MISIACKLITRSMKIVKSIKNNSIRARRTRTRRKNRLRSLQVLDECMSYLWDESNKISTLRELIDHMWWLWRMWYFSNAKSMLSEQICWGHFVAAARCSMSTELNLPSLLIDPKIFPEDRRFPRPRRSHDEPADARSASLLKIPSEFDRWSSIGEHIQYYIQT